MEKEREGRKGRNRRERGKEGMGVKIEEWRKKRGE